MKKPLLFLLLLVTVILHGKGSFVDASQAVVYDEEFEKEKMIIEEIFKLRSELWNQLYEDTNTSHEWIKELENIVTKPLLDFDIESFKMAKGSPTDIDRVIGLKLIDISDVVYRKGKMEAKIKVNWKMQSISSPYEEEINYEVVLKRESEQWKLSDYKINQ